MRTKTNNGKGDMRKKHVPKEHQTNYMRHDGRAVSLFATSPRQVRAVFATVLRQARDTQVRLVWLVGAHWFLLP